MSKSRKKLEIPVTTNSQKRVENAWTLLVKDDLLENDNFHVITLPHPAHGTPSKYGLDMNNKKVYEVVTFNEPHRSWFIGETVKSDGSLLMLTPINPLFLVLPRLQKQCANKAVPLEDILSEKGFDKLLDFVPTLDLVADMKGPADIRAYKYNEEKTLNWLEGRVHKLAAVLKEKNIHVRPGSVSATFVTSSIGGETVNEEFYLKYAHGIVSEYLQEDLLKLLENKFNFTPDLLESLGSKRKSEADDSMKSGKKMKQGETVEACKENMGIFNKSAGEIVKPKVLSTKEKARHKAASGTKTISSFFTKK